MGKRKNPETSNEAYRSLKVADITRTKQDILLALAVIKEGTFEDIAKQVGVRPEIIWKRLSELCNDGKIYRPGNKRPLKSGRCGYTWMLVTPGVSPAKIVELLMPGDSISTYSKRMLAIQKELF